MAQPPPFDPNALADWLVEGVKETLEYRAKQFRDQLLDREQWLAYLRSKVPNKNQVIHFALKQALEQAGFEFEIIKQGDATFHLIRKTIRKVASSDAKRLMLIPGFGDSPASWLTVFTLASSDLYRNFDEILLLDFPGYMGFLAHHDLVTSMDMLLNVVQMVVERYHPNVLVGHSLGGWLASRVAQNISRSVDHMILVAPSGLIPEMDRKPFGDLFRRHQDIEIEQFLELVVHAPKRFQGIMKSEVKKFYTQKSIVEFIESVQPDHFVDPSKPFAAKKLTAIWGDNDRLVPSHWLRHWIEHFGEVTDAYVMENTGHVPQFEHPLVLSRVLLHAILGQKGLSGPGWKKIQTRKREFSETELKKNPSPNLKLIG